MGVVGFQDYWVTGSYLYFKRDDVGVAKQPLFDVGVIETASPTTDVERLELEDSRSGQKRIVDETVTKLDESYDVVVSNINLDNLALLFLSESPAAYTQTAAQKLIVHYAHSARLLKILDATDGDPVYALRIEGVLGGGSSAPVSFAITAIDKATKTITVATITLADGEHIVVTGKGLANVDNAGTYTTDGAVVAGTSIVVIETFAADETAITGEVLQEAAFDDWLIDGTDWDRVDEYKGIIRLIPGGSHAADGNLTVYYSLRTLSGNRKVTPQSLKGEVKGTVFIYWSRGDNDEITVRKAKATISPNAAAFSNDEYSTLTLSVRILSDLTATDIAGELVAIKGSIPAAS